MGVIKNRDQYYNFLLFSLVFLFPFGTRLLVAEFLNIHFSLFRLVLLVTLAILSINRDLALPWKQKGWLLTAFLFYLFIFGLISLSWVEDTHAALQQISHTGWGISVLLVFYSLLKRVHSGLHVVYIAWTAAFFCLALFAVIEILGAVHFESSFVDSLCQYDSFRMVFHAPLATFSNPNDYAVFITFSLIFMVVYTTFKNLWVLITAIVLSCFILVQTQSNLAFFASYYLLITILLHLCLRLLSHPITKKSFYLPVFRQPTHRPVSVMIITVSMLAAVFVTIIANPLFIHIPDHPEKRSFIPLKKNIDGLNLMANNMLLANWHKKETTTNPFESESYNIRRNLLINGWCMAKQSSFSGIGAGQYVHTLGHHPQCADIAISTNPHSFVIEIFSQYGMLPLFIFMSFILITLMKAIRSVFGSGFTLGILPVAWLMILLIPAYLLLSNAPSSFISHPMNWIVLTLLAYCNQRNPKQTL
jgi:hypothetical protein